MVRRHRRPARAGGSRWAGGVGASSRALEERPDAKKLCVCTVDAGADLGELTIVTGADNAVPGLVTALAPLGSAVWTPSGASLIKRSKVRGVESEGMLCSLKELGLLKPGEADPTGAVVLKASAEPGAAFDASLIAGDDEEEEEAAAPAPGTGRRRRGGGARRGYDDATTTTRSASSISRRSSHVRISPGTQPSTPPRSRAPSSRRSRRSRRATSARRPPRTTRLPRLQVGPRAAAHARLAAADALALDISRAGVRSADAVTYAAALRRAGYASAAELDGAGPTPRR